jgi:acetyltransferase
VDLHKLLRPSSMAIIGASEKDGFGSDTCKNILNNRKDFQGVYFVNPSRERVFGQKCFKSVEDIEGSIDLAVICTPQKLVNDLILQASKKGCGAVVVFASGYSETGTAEGKKRQQELIELCNRLDILLMGPNCAGFANFIDHVFAFGLTVQNKETAGKIGLISQSGQICASALDMYAMNFSYIIASGNSAGVKMEDYIDFLIEDESTKVVAIYIEGINQTEKFVQVLRKAAIKKKPIVVLKTGRSKKGSQLAASHTGSLAGSDTGINALFEKFGVIRVNDIQELFFTAIMFDTLKELPKTTKFASVNVSGGEAGVIADVAHLNHVEYADICPETLEKLREIMPSYATPNNPLDMTATLAYDSEKFSLALRAMMEDETVGSVLVGWTVLSEIIDPVIYHLTDGIEKVINEPWAKPVMLVPFVEHTRNQGVLKRLLSLGVPILPSSSYAFRILKYLTDFIEYDYTKRTLHIAIPEKVEKTQMISLSENDSKAMLKEFGFAINEEIIAATAEQALLAAEKIGYPLVMKIESADILHKSDIGGVRLNIQTKEEVVNTFIEIMDNAAKLCPKAKLNGVLIQRMLPKGVEVIVGVNNDPQFGPLVMVGLGGVFVEVFKDVKIYPAPFSKNEAIEIINSLKGIKLLTGYRGEKSRDIEALANFIVKISEFAVATKDEIKELDINPVFVYQEGEGIAVADALIVKYQKNHQLTF